MWPEDENCLLPQDELLTLGITHPFRPFKWGRRWVVGLACQSTAGLTAQYRGTRSPQLCLFLWVGGRWSAWLNPTWNGENAQTPRTHRCGVWGSNPRWCRSEATVLPLPSSAGIVYLSVYQSIKVLFFTCTIILCRVWNAWLLLW